MAENSANIILFNLLQPLWVNLLADKPDLDVPNSWK